MTAPDERTTSQHNAWSVPEQGPTGQSPPPENQSWPTPPTPPSYEAETPPSYGAPPPYGAQTPYGVQTPYGAPPPDGVQTPYSAQTPYGVQAPYGTQIPLPDGGQAPQYGPYGYPSQPWGVPAYYGQAPVAYYGQAPVAFTRRHYGSWLERIASAIIDWAGPGIIGGVAMAVLDGIGALIELLALAWVFYNAYRAGATGQSLGKKLCKLRLVHQATGQPIGGGLGIGRHLLHVVDSLPFYLGFLWPLWDAKRQTFADKLVSSVVIRDPARQR